MDEILITNHCINGKCSNCGECCTDALPLTKNEVKNIRAYIRKHNVKENVYMNEDSIDFRCPFYVKDNERHCSIYPVRPTICRNFRCNQSKDYIELNKSSLSIKADYNRFYNHSYQHSFVSLHNLFYDNYKFEIQAIYSFCSNNKDAAKNFINNECLNKYIIEEEEN